MPYYPPPVVNSPTSGDAAPPLVIPANQTYNIPNNKQVLVAVPIELEPGASIEQDGTGVLVIIR